MSKLLLILLLFVGGCASLTPTFYNAHVTQEQATRDCLECKQLAYASCMNNVFAAYDIQERCMREKGYSVK